MFGLDFLSFVDGWLQSHWEIPCCVALFITAVFWDLFSTTHELSLLSSSVSRYERRHPRTTHILRLYPRRWIIMSTIMLCNSPRSLAHPFATHHQCLSAALSRHKILSTMVDIDPFMVFGYTCHRVQSCLHTLWPVSSVQSTSVTPPFGADVDDDTVSFFDCVAAGDDLRDLDILWDPNVEDELEDELDNQNFDWLNLEHLQYSIPYFVDAKDADMDTVDLPSPLAYNAGLLGSID